MSIAKLKRLQDEFLAAIGTDRHDSAKLRLLATTNANLPLLVEVAKAAVIMRLLQKRGARDPNEHAMIAASADKLDRAIAKLEVGKE